MLSPDPPRRRSRTRQRRKLASKVAETAAAIDTADAMVLRRSARLKRDQRAPRSRGG
jgi:hypothetical protein